uniref:ATP-dependent helicase C-terminal domain-containing protein n=1 Tax=Timema monikensis TaxID=170555 RepID=A0A7R9E3P0_9NEOP|nr:unnamed protein product [Timema monikensis]
MVSGNMQLGGVEYNTDKGNVSYSILGLSGSAWYQLEASRAVNQAVGRVIRHANDYGAILLCDTRFDNPTFKKELSVWLQPFIKTFKNFGEITKDVSCFFRAAAKMLPPPNTRLSPGAGKMSEYKAPPPVAASFDTFARFTNNRAVDHSSNQGVSNKTIAVSEWSPDDYKSAPSSSRETTTGDLFGALERQTQVKEALATESFKKFAEGVKHYNRTKQFDDMFDVLMEVFLGSENLHPLFLVTKYCGRSHDGLKQVRNSLSPLQGFHCAPFASLSPSTLEFASVTAWVRIGLTAAILVLKNSSCQNKCNHFNLEVECLGILFVCTLEIPIRDTKGCGTAVILCVGTVVQTTVGEDPSHVRYEQPSYRVVSRLQSSVSGSLHSSVTLLTLVFLATGFHPVSWIPGILSTGITLTPSLKHVRPGFESPGCGYQHGMACLDLYVEQILCLRVKHHPGDVLLGHLRQLVGKHILESYEPEDHLLGDWSSQGVTHHMELDDALLLFLLSGFIPRCVLWEHRLTNHPSQQSYMFNSATIWATVDNITDLWPNHVNTFQSCDNLSYYLFWDIFNRFNGPPFFCFRSRDT